MSLCLPRTDREEAGIQDVSEDPPWAIVWNEDLSVGIAEMDDDHERFIAMVNGLNQAIIGREGREQIRRRLHLIVLDAKDHFRHEQQLLDEFGYPDAAHHAGAHTKLMGRIIEAMDFVHRSEGRELWIEQGLLIKGLLVEHLLNEDMRYRDFLISKIGTDRR
jgi:hemerythrin-like metal-binding protein